MTSFPARLYWTAFTAWHTRGQSRLPYRPLDEILAIQSRRVRRIVAHAFATVPFYRRAMRQRGLLPEDFRSAEDLALLPVISGRDLASHPLRFRSTLFTSRDVLETYSSGTTGHRKALTYDRRTLLLGFAEAQRRRDVMAALLGRAHRARILQFRTAGSGVDRQMQVIAGSTLVPRRLRADRLVVSPALPVAAAAELLNEFRPDLVHGYASFLGAFFREAIARGLLTHRPRVILHDSEVMAEADRQLIARELGATLVSSYVAAESLFIAFQCERCRGFHVDVDRVALRVVDPAGVALPPGGRGEVVVSNLTNRATVLLNYRLGDIVTLSDAPCGCGRALPTLDAIDGRTDDVLVLPDGRWVHGRRVSVALGRCAGLIQAQVCQEAIGRFLVRAVAAPSAEPAGLADALRQTLASLVGADAMTTVEFVPALPREPSGKTLTIWRLPGVPVPTDSAAPENRAP